MYSAAHKPSQNRAPHHPGIGHYPEAFLRFEVRQDERTAAVTHHHRYHEIRCDDKQSLFLFQIGNALLEVILITGKGIRFFCRRNLRFLHADLRFKRGCDGKCSRIKEKQRREAHMLITPGGNGHHQRGKRVDHAGDGIRLGIVPFADEHGI